MGKDLSPFHRTLSTTRRQLDEMMMKAESPYSIAMWKLLVSFMELQLKQDRRFLEALIATTMPNDMPPEIRWVSMLKTTAEKTLDPEKGDPKAFANRVSGYKQLSDELSANVRKRVVDRFRYRIDVIGHNSETIEIIDLIGIELQLSIHFHRYDTDFLRVSPSEALLRLLEVDRRDLDVALRIALEMPKDIMSYDLPAADKPAYVDAVEFGISFIPFVGSAVAAYEAWRGKDLFGYALSDLERGILAASVVLPWAGRAVKEGRALYTAERMGKMYGHDAVRYSYSLAMGERLSADAVGLSRLRKAEAMVVGKKAIEKKFAQELADTLRSLGLKNADKAITKEIDAKLVTAFQKLSAKNPAFSVLDAYAIERIAAKAANVNHLKGQLLEEILESRMNTWLRDGLCKKALGLEHIKEPLTFVPGHIIRDTAGRQITDGILAFEIGGKLKIVAVFEAKAGRHASRELSIARNSISKMSKRELREARMEAAEELRELRERARLEGKTVDKTVDDLIKDLPTKEEGGQIRRDIERLYESDIYIGSVKAAVDISPTGVKFFGVIPSDVAASAIKKQLAEARIRNFDVLGLGLSSRNLTDAASNLAKSLSLDIVL